MGVIPTNQKADANSRRLIAPLKPRPHPTTSRKGRVVHHSKFRRMSASGQNRTFARDQPMSALPPKADIPGKACLSPHWREYSSQNHRASYQATLDHRQFAHGATQMSRVCKTDQIRNAWATGDRIGALRIAAQFFDRSADTKIFKRVMDAHKHPDFYRQLGKNPGQIVGNALAVLAKRFSLC
jgi:hypothetical protein